MLFVGLGLPPSRSAAPDQLEYELFAFQLSEGNGYCFAPGRPTASRPPGTSLALLPIYLTFGRSYMLGRLWFCVLSAATCVAAAWLARECFGLRTGIIAGIGLALYPGHFYYSMRFVSEVPFNTFPDAGVWVCDQSPQKQKLGFDVLAGLSWGFAVLTRPQILLI